jgi:uncharacterized membrane protein YhaH (DUF805 family)
VHWYTDVLRKYVAFDGRATRPEYWWFTLISVIIAIVIELVVLAGGGSGGSAQAAADIYELAVLLPSLAVSIRRLHDTNRSGWWVLVGLIPLAGWVWIIVLLAMPGDPGPNRYGQDPRGGGDARLFDVQTGERLAPAARFDPYIGQPLPPRFDPQTGEPLT